MSVSDLADAVDRVCALLQRAHDALATAVDDAEQARDMWAAQIQESHDEVQAVPHAAEQARLTATEAMSALMASEQLLRGYLDSLDAPGTPAPRPSSSATASAPTKPEPIKRAATPDPEGVRAAQERVGSREDGTPAQGEWVRSDGWAVRLRSGPGDEHFQTARALIAARLPRPVSRLATHVEVKVAARMRKEQLSDETLVIDRGVCGTRPFDDQRQYTCDRFLPRILPPGARLRVVQPDGTIREYEGEADE